MCTNVWNLAAEQAEKALITVSGATLDRLELQSQDKQDKPFIQSIFRIASSLDRFVKPLGVSVYLSLHSIKVYNGNVATIQFYSVPRNRVLWSWVLILVIGFVWVFSQNSERLDGLSFASSRELKKPTLLAFFLLLLLVLTRSCWWSLLLSATLRLKHLDSGFLPGPFGFIKVLQLCRYPPPKQQKANPRDEVNKCLYESKYSQRVDSFVCKTLCRLWTKSVQAICAYVLYHGITQRRVALYSASDLALT